MKFFLPDNSKNNSHIRMILLPFIAFIILFLMGDLLSTLSNLGLNPTSVADYYRGNENKLLEPRGIILILEEIHIRSFLFGFSILVSSCLLLQTSVSRRKKNILIITSFTSGLIDSLGGILIAYLHPFFSFPKIFSFLILYLSLFIMILIIIVHLWKQRREE